MIGCSWCYLIHHTRAYINIYIKVSMRFILSLDKKHPFLVLKFKQFLQFRRLLRVNSYQVRVRHSLKHSVFELDCISDGTIVKDGIGGQI